MKFTTYACRAIAAHLLLIASMNGLQSFFIRNKRKGGIFISEEASEIRQQIYILFSHLFSKPTSELRSELCGGVHEELFQNYSEFADDVSLPKSWHPENIPKLSEWMNLWKKNFQPGDAKVRLIESVYKPWTVDDSCQMPFADEKGFIMGDWAHHMLHLYDLFNFELPEEFSHCPDHLVLELEFMSLLVEEVEHEKQQQFIEQHLDWIDELKESGKESEVAEEFLDLFNWLQSFLASDKDYLTG